MTQPTETQTTPPTSTPTLLQQFFRRWTETVDAAVSDALAADREPRLIDVLADVVDRVEAQPDEAMRQLALAALYSAADRRIAARCNPSRADLERDWSGDAEVIRLRPKRPARRQKPRV